MGQRTPVVIACCAVLSIAPLARCSCDADGNPSLDGFVDTGTDPSEANDTTADTPHEYDVPEIDGETVCDEDDFEMHREIVELMLLLDQSASMRGSPWNDATDALQQMLLDPIVSEFYFGLDAFPDGYPGFWAACGTLCMGCMEDSCGTLAVPQVALGPRSTAAGSIIMHMGDPSFPKTCANTPLVDQLKYYDTGDGSTVVPQLYDGEGNAYLVVISDGEDTCTSGTATSELSAAAASILSVHGIKSIAIGFGATTAEMEAELDAIASSGGSPFADHIDAPDGDALAAALESIASTVLTCTYVLDDVAPTANPNLVNFYVDEVLPANVIPRDEGCTESSGAGWDWQDAGHTSVTFCGTYCEQIKSGAIAVIKATFGCGTILI